MSSAGHWDMGQRKKQQRMRTTEEVSEEYVTNLSDVCFERMGRYAFSKFDIIRVRY